jgi:hypothetical protein
MATKRSGSTKRHPLDKAGRTGAEVTLPKQESGEKNCGSYEAHNQRFVKRAQPRFATRPSPMIEAMHE